MKKIEKNPNSKINNQQSIKKNSKHFSPFCFISFCSHEIFLLMFHMLCFKSSKSLFSLFSLFLSLSKFLSSLRFLLFAPSSTRSLFRFQIHLKFISNSSQIHLRFQILFDSKIQHHLRSFVHSSLRLNHSSAVDRPPSAVLRQENSNLFSKTCMRVCACIHACV